MAIRLWIIFTIIFIVLALGLMIFLIIKFFLTPSGSTSFHDAPGMSDLPESSRESSPSSPPPQPQTNLPSSTVESIHEEPMLDDSSPSTTASSSTEEFYCPYCGAKVDKPDSSFCPNCGAQLPE